MIPKKYKRPKVFHNIDINWVLRCPKCNFFVVWLQWWFEKKIGFNTKCPDCGHMIIREKNKLREYNEIL